MTHAERRLRAERLLLLARYDHYKFPPAFMNVVTILEKDIAWLHHREETRISRPVRQIEHSRGIPSGG
jgi:hypothetical protein